jgi:hypothetical protein
VLPRGLQHFGLVLVRKKRSADQKFLIRLRILRVAPLYRLLFLRRKMQIQSLRDFQCGLLLQRKHILYIAGEIVGPRLKTRIGIDELHVDAHLRAIFPHAAFQQVTNI